MPDKFVFPGGRIEAAMKAAGVVPTQIGGGLSPGSFDVDLDFATTPFGSAVTETSQLEPSANAPCTRTMFLIGAAPAAVLVRPDRYVFGHAAEPAAVGTLTAVLAERLQ